MVTTLRFLLISLAIVWLIDRQIALGQSTDSPAEIRAPAIAASAPEPARLSFMDRRMAACLAIDTETGIELAQWAAAHARDEKVKQHAQRMMTEGIALLKLLDERTDGRATKVLRNLAEGHEDAPTTGPAAQSASTVEPPVKVQPRLNVLNAERVLMQMKLEIAEASAGALRSHFDARIEGDADRYYVAGEVFRQVQMLSTLKVLRKYTSPAFAPILDDAITTTDRQLADTMALLGGVPTEHALSAAATSTVAGKQGAIPARGSR